MATCCKPGRFLHSTCAASCQSACRDRSIKLPTCWQPQKSCELVANYSWQPGLATSSPSGLRPLVHVFSSNQDATVPVRISLLSYGKNNDTYQHRTITDKQTLGGLSAIARLLVGSFNESRQCGSDLSTPDQRDGEPNLM